MGLRAVAWAVPALVSHLVIWHQADDGWMAINGSPPATLENCLGYTFLAIDKFWSCFVIAGATAKYVGKESTLKNAQAMIEYEIQMDPRQWRGPYYVSPV